MFVHFQKFDYDSSTVRKRFFREALLQIFIPYMLKQLSPSCAPVSPTPGHVVYDLGLRLLVSFRKKMTDLLHDLSFNLLIEGVLKDV